MPIRKLRIVIPGGTGHLGVLLARHFHDQGHLVSTITRFPKPGDWEAVHWDGETVGEWAHSLEGADVVINLAGRSVNCRYTVANRRAIKSSRVLTTTLLGEAIARCARPPRLWLNASTAIIYRHSLEEPMDELTGELGGCEPDVPPRWRFSVEVAVAWEQAFFSALTPFTRKIALRTAPVMSPEAGGIFDLLLRLVRVGLGGKAGSGRQFVSWIHYLDFINAIEFLIDRIEFNGCVNVTAPVPLSNEEFMYGLRQAWYNSTVALPLPALPSPEWLLAAGAFLLRTEPELLLKSRRVIPTLLTIAGFQFDYPTWPAAAEDLIARRQKS